MLPLSFTQKPPAEWAGARRLGVLVIFNCGAVEKLSFALQNLPHAAALRLQRVLVPPSRSIQKARRMAGFLYGGDEGARTHDLTDVNRAL